MQYIEYDRCNLDPGCVAISCDPAMIFSVCGNGVLVILRDRIKRFGGVAYCIYPKKKMFKSPSNYYADVAIASLVRSMLSVNSYVKNLEAQIFGGADYRGYRCYRGGKIVKACRKALRKHKIDIVSEDVGGVLGRKVMVNTFSGEVAVLKTRHIRKSDWIKK